MLDYSRLCFNRDCVSQKMAKPDLKYCRPWDDSICFENLGWVRSALSTDLMCCFVCGCGPYGWRLDSTFRLVRECSLPFHVWIDSKTSVKDARCIEGSCGHLFSDGFLSVFGHMTTYRNDTKTGLDTYSNLISLFWEVGEVCGVQSTDFDALLCVGVDRTACVLTYSRRLGSECSLPFHVWIDSRTSVKCVKDARCIEGSCGHLVRLQNCNEGVSC